MGTYASYDPQERVILADFSGLLLTRAILKAARDEIIALARTLPEKVYLITCWQDVRLEEGFGEYYGDMTAGLLKEVRGIVRYAATDPLTNITLRTQTVTHHFQGSRSHLYPSREEAVAAVRRLEAQTP